MHLVSSPSLICYTTHTRLFNVIVSYCSKTRTRQRVPTSAVNSTCYFLTRIQVFSSRIDKYKLCKVNLSQLDTISYKYSVLEIKKNIYSYIYIRNLFP